MRSGDHRRGADSYAYSPDDRLLTTGSLTLAYDLDGYLTSKTEAGQSTHYVCGARGELKQVTLPDARIIDYVNDPYGRHIAVFPFFLSD